MEKTTTFKPQVKELENTTFWQQFGNKSRIELKNSSFGIGKVAIGLQKFDENNKQTAYCTSYIDFDKALVLANDILSGKFARMVEKSSEDMVKVYTLPGGQSAEKANREDKKPLYRELTISKGKLWIISAQEGPGKVTSTGGFTADGKPDRKVNVGLSNEGLKAFALMLQNEISSYRTAQYMKLLLDE